MRFFNLFLPLVGQSLGITEVLSGTSLSIASLTRAIVLIPAGIIADRTQLDRVFLTIAILGQSLVYIALTFAIEPLHLFYIAPLQGATQAIITGILLSRIARIAPKGKMGRSIGYYTATFSLGLAIGSSMGGPIIEILGLMTAYTYLAIVMGFATLSLLLYKPKQTKDQIGKEAEQSQNPSASKIKWKPPRSFIHLLGSHVIHNLGFGGFYAFFALYVIALGGTPFLIGVSDGMSQFVSLILIPFMGELADRKGAKVLIMIAFWGDMLLVALMGMITDPFLIFPLMVLNGVNGAASATGLLSMAASQVTTNKGGALATANTVMNIGFTFSPIFGGTLLSIGGFSLLLPYSIIALFISATWASIKVHPLDANSNEIKT